MKNADFSGVFASGGKFWRTPAGGGRRGFLVIFYHREQFRTGIQVGKFSQAGPGVITIAADARPPLRGPPWQGSDYARYSVCPARAGVMLKVKDTLRSTVHLGFDGRVFKAYHGPDAPKRFANEVRVLRYLAARGCPFVPRLLEEHPDQLRIVTTNCGMRVERIDDERAARLFAELETYGVRHEDADKRNITYRFSDGRFCLIDFEFATILPDVP